MAAVVPGKEGEFEPRVTETRYDWAHRLPTETNYDADGDLIRRGLPNGLTAATTDDQAGEPTKLAYTKTSSCGKGAGW